MKDLLKFLILYSTIVFTDVEKEHKGEKEDEKAKVDFVLENRIKPSMIDLLPILVTLLEDYLIPISKEYQNYAR